jgi:rod shape determining protein RodA
LPILYVFFAVLSILVLSSISSNVLPIQLLAFGLGGVIFLGVQTVPLSLWKHFHVIFYLFSLGLLLLNLAIGQVTRGAVSWIPLGPINVQPSQIAQPFILLTAAVMMAKYSLKSAQGLLTVAALILIPAVSILAEPDLGTTAVLLSAVAAMVWVSDIPFKTVAAGIAALVLIALLSWVFILKPYQKDRVLSFLNPSYDPTGAGYNAYQSMVAVGSGQLLGRGLGEGVQSQLRFLPERHTDFFFASLSEELGFLGGSAVIVAYLIILAHLSSALIQPADRFHLFLGTGLLSLLMIQVFINIGMNIAIVPITGITLPFLSYGGSSLIGYSLLLGLLQRVVLENTKKKIKIIQ